VSREGNHWPRAGQSGALGQMARDGRWFVARGPAADGARGGWGEKGLTSGSAGSGGRAGVAGAAIGAADAQLRAPEAGLAFSGSIGFLGPLGPFFFGQTSSLSPRTSTRISASGFVESEPSFEQFLTYSVYNGHVVNEIPRPGCMGVQITGRLAGNMERTVRILRVRGPFSTPVTNTAP
jgi:hypothetical protein